MRSAIPRAKIHLTFEELFGFMSGLIFKSPEPAIQERLLVDFESEFARQYGIARGVVFSKARIGLYFLLKEMNLHPGGEVIISDINIADFVNVIRCAGFTPVVADVNCSTYCIDYADLEKKINRNTALVLITYLSGFVPDMDRIVEITTRRNVPFIEDCSQAVSSLYKGRLLGTFGVAAIFSLSLLKPVCTLFGGMVISSDSELIERLRKRQHELPHAGKWPLLREAIKNIVVKLATGTFLFPSVVFPLIRISSAPLDFLSRFQRSAKSVILRSSLPDSFLVRFSWAQAVLGLSQLQSVQQRENNRKEFGRILYSSIKNTIHLQKPDTIEEGENAFWLFPVRAKDPCRFRKHLARYHVDSSGYLLSVLSREDAFQELGFTTVMAGKLKDGTIFIPMYDQLDHNQVQQLVTAVASYDGQGMHSR